MYARCCMCPRRPLRPLLILLALVFSVFVLLQLTGCVSSLMGHKRQTLYASLAPRTPQEAYTQVVQSASQFGVLIMSNDPPTRTLSGLKNSVVQMNISVDADSQVTMTCQLLPGSLFVGDMDECVQYRQLLTGARADAR
jgi:hypothetical protein